MRPNWIGTVAAGIPATQPIGILVIKLIQVAVVLLLYSNFALATENDRPNIVVILADDLGYGDVQPLNPRSKIATPNFNRVAREGMLFVDAHSPSAVCTPTRYGLMCGRYPWRSPMKRGVLGGYSKPLIGEDRQTIASILKSAGYQTSCVGKWHLGLGWQWSSESPDGDINNMGIAGGKPGLVDYAKPLTHGPISVGFDDCLIIPASLDMSPYVYIRNDRVTAIPQTTIQHSKFPAFYRKGEIAADFRIDEVLDRLTAEACRLIKEKSAKTDPFFLYFALSAPHKPVLPQSRFIGKTRLGPYGDFITQVDWTVGQVLTALDENNVAENTLLIVTSDNGSFMNRQPDKPVDHARDSRVHGYHPDTHTANGPLRGTKADIWEAGHRVPFFVRWPGKVKINQKSSRTICHTDILATAAEVAGANFDNRNSEDSFSFLATLIGNTATPRKPVIHQSGSGHLAIRDLHWKLILGSGSGGREKPRGKPFEKPFHLFNLEDDLAETENLIDSQSQQAERLHRLFLEISNSDHEQPKSAK